MKLKDVCVTINKTEKESITDGQFKMSSMARGLHKATCERVM